MLYFYIKIIAIEKLKFSSEKTHRSEKNVLPFRDAKLWNDVTIHAYVVTMSWFACTTPLFWGRMTQIPVMLPESARFGKTTKVCH